MNATPVRLRAAVGLWAVAVAWVAGARTLAFGWAMIDDGVLVARRPTVFDPLQQPVGDLLLTPGMGHAMPVTNASLALDYALYGLSPGGWHATNVLWFAALLVTLSFLGLRVLRAERWPAAFAVASVVALVGWHPVTAEPLGWISSRKDLVAATFASAALLSIERTRWALAFAALALGAKSTMVALGPPLALGLWRAGASRTLLVRFGVGWTVVAVAAVALAKRQQAETWQRVMTSGEHLLAWAASTGDHLLRLLWPLDVPVYATPDVLLPSAFDGVVAMAVLGALLWALRRLQGLGQGDGDPFASATIPLGVFGAACALAPVVLGASSLVTALADRYVFAVWVPWGAFVLFGVVARLGQGPRAPRALAVASAAGALIAALLLPHHASRLEAWRSPVSFYERARVTDDLRASSTLGEAWSCYWRGSVFVASPDHERQSFAATPEERDLRLMLAYLSWNACAPGPRESCAEDDGLACRMRNLVRSDRDRAHRMWRQAPDLRVEQ